MMGRALLIVGAVATLALAATGVLGYLIPWPPPAETVEATGGVPEEMSLHIPVGLGSTLLLLFSHCWILIYLLGTGRAIRRAVRQRGLEPELAERTRRFKKACYTLILLAMAFSLAAFVTGTGVTTGTVPGWVHGMLFYAALAVQVPALALERRALDDNERLIADVDRRVEGLPAA